MLCGLACYAYAQDLPRLAVVEFDVNINTPKANRDAVTVRNLVESQMVATQKYQIITRTDIDKLLENQRIQVSSIGSAENIRKLQLQNISYIVTGSVDAMDSDYLITVKLLDVSTGQFSHSANAFMNSSSRDLYNGVIQLINTFAAGMTSRGGQVAQAPQAAPQPPQAAPQPPPQPSAPTYKVGDRGPAGGWIFYDKGSFSDGWRYLEAAPAGTEFTALWGAYGQDVTGTDAAVGSGKRNTQTLVEYLRRIRESGRAAQLCDELAAGGYYDWFLPSKDELNLMYQNLKQRGIGGFSNDWYWSSSQNWANNAWAHRFSDDKQDDYYKGLGYKVRAARSF
jgi:TolB-like protein